MTTETQKQTTAPSTGDGVASGTVFVSYCREEANIIDSHVATLRAAGHEVFIDRDSIEVGAAWRSKIESTIDRCMQVQLFWSERASGSKFIRHEYITALGLRAERGDSFLIVHALDTTPLPLELADLQIHRWPQRLSEWLRISLAVCAALSLLPLAVVVATMTPLRWSLWASFWAVALAVVGVGGWMLFGRAERRHLMLVDRLDRAEDWLRDPDRWTVLKKGEDILYRVYGRRVLSRRTFIRASLLSLVAVGLVVGSSMLVYGAESGLKVFLTPLFFGMPFVLWVGGTNVVCDLCSLAVTMSLLRVAKSRPRPLMLLGLIGLDLAIALSLTLLPVLLGPILYDGFLEGRWPSISYLFDNGLDSYFGVAPTVFNRPDLVVPNATSEWFFWHPVPFRWEAYAFLMFPNTFVGLMAAMCLVTSCLPTVLLLVLLGMSVAHRQLRRILTLGAGFLCFSRSRWVRRFVVLFPAALVVLCTWLRFGTSPVREEDKRLRGHALRSLIEGCRYDEGLDAIDQCIEAARRKRDAGVRWEAQVLWQRSARQLIHHIRTERSGEDETLIISPDVGSRAVRLIASGYPNFLSWVVNGVQVRRVGSISVDGLRLGDPRSIAEVCAALAEHVGLDIVDLELATWTRKRKRRRRLRLDNSRGEPLLRDDATPVITPRYGERLPNEISETTRIRLVANHLIGLFDDTKPAELRFNAPGANWRIRGTGEGIWLISESHGLEPPSFESLPAQFTLLVDPPAKQSLDSSLVFERIESPSDAFSEASRTEGQQARVVAGIAPEGSFTGWTQFAPVTTFAAGTTVRLRSPWVNQSLYVTSEVYDWVHMSEVTSYPNACNSDSTFVTIGHEPLVFSQRRCGSWRLPSATTTFGGWGDVRLRGGDGVWITIPPDSGIILRVVSTRDVIQANAPIVGRIRERMVLDGSVSEGVLLAPPSMGESEALIQIAGANGPELAFLSKRTTSVDPTLGDPFFRGMAKWEFENINYGEFYRALLHRSDNVLSVNGHFIDDGSAFRHETMHDPVVIRSDDDHVVLLVERSVAVGEDKDKRVLVEIEYEPHPAEPEVGRRWLDKAVGSSPIRNTQTRGESD